MAYRMKGRKLGEDERNGFYFLCNTWQKETKRLTRETV